MKNTDSMKAMIRQQIATCTAMIRECRKSRSVPCLMGQGWTVAIKDSNSCLHIEGREGDKVSYSFAGCWNRGSVYYSKDAARRVLGGLINSRPELRLVLRHHDDLRDRQEKSALECLAACLPHRNHAA